MTIYLKCLFKSINLRISLASVENTENQEMFVLPMYTHYYIKPEY